MAFWRASDRRKARRSFAACVIAITHAAKERRAVLHKRADIVVVAKACNQEQGGGHSYKTCKGNKQLKHWHIFDLLILLTCVHADIRDAATLQGTHSQPSLLHIMSTPLVSM